MALDSKVVHSFEWMAQRSQLIFGVDAFQWANVFYYVSIICGPISFGWYEYDEFEDLWWKAFIIIGTGSLISLLFHITKKYWREILKLTSRNAYEAASKSLRNPIEEHAYGLRLALVAKVIAIFALSSIHPFILLLNVLYVPLTFSFYLMSTTPLMPNARDMAPQPT